MQKPYVLAVAVLGLALALTTGSLRAQYHNHHGGEPDYPKFDYDSLFAAATPLERSPEGQTVLQECLAAYGGVEHLRKLKGFRSAWTLTSPLNSGPVTVIRNIDSGRRHRIQSGDPRWTRIRIMNGEQAWFMNRDTVIALDSMRYKAEVFSNVVLHLPFSLENEPFSDRRYGERADDSLHYIYLEKADSLLLVVGIDPANRMIRVVEGVVKHGKSHMTFVNLYADYRPVQGYFLPHSVTNISMGLKVGHSTIESVEINPDFPAEEFTPALAKEDAY